MARVWDRYSQTFGAWKELDSARIVQGLVDTYMELNALRESVQGPEHLALEGAATAPSPQAEEWLPKIFAQQNAIRQRLRQLGAERAIAEALVFQATARQNQAATSAAAAAKAPKPQAGDGEALGSSPAGASAALLDAKLARDIIANPDFCLEKKSAKDGFQFHVKEIAEKAFYDLLREELSQSPPNCRRIPSLVGELRDHLLDLVGETDAKRITDIRGLCDPEFISDQIERQVFDAAQYMKSITTVLGNMCSPARDADVASLGTSLDIADFFQRCFSVVDDMKLDMANFRLQAIRPQLVEIGVSYEREKFQECLKSGGITLARTTDWLKRALVSLRQDGLAANPATCVERGYLHLFQTRPGASEGDALPETLELDKERVRKWKVELGRLSLAITIRTLLYAVVPPLADLSQDLTPAIAGTVKNFLGVSKDSDKHGKSDWLTSSIIKTAVDALKDAGRVGGMAQKAIDLLGGQIRACVAGSSPVMKVLSSRINSFVADCIKRVEVRYGSQKYKLPSPHPSLLAIQKDLSAVSLKIAQLTTHNRDVHQAIYDNIVRSSLA